MAINPRTIARLKSQLLTSGLSQKDQPLFQIINQLIDSLNGVDAVIGSGGSGVGPIGPPGPQGTNAVSFMYGYDGTDGEDGQPGLIGPQGFSGTTGPQGSPGLPVSPSIDGTDGEDGFSIPGPQGLQGLSGLNGLPGIPGIDGQDGIDAFPIPGPQGPAGTNGSSTYITNGTGNPQGMQSQPLGVLWIDTNNGDYWRKLGGASSAYGWYLFNGLGLDNYSTKRSFEIWSPLDTSNTNTGATTGSFAGGIVIGLITTSASNQARQYVGNETFSYFDTGVTINTTSYLNTTASQYRWCEYDIDATLRMRTPSDITNIRLWFVVSTAALTNSDFINAGAKSAAGFRYSTNVPDGGWVGFSANATATGSVTSTVAAIAADTTYKLRVRLVRAGTPTLYFSVNDGTEISTTTNIPPTGVNYAWYWGLTNLTGAIRGYRWANLSGWVGTP